MFLHYNTKYVPAHYNQLYLLEFRELDATVCDLLDIVQAMEEGETTHLVCSIDDSVKQSIDSGLYWLGCDATLETLEQLSNVIEEG